MSDMEMEPCLQADGPRIFRQKVGVVIKKIFIEPCDTWVCGKPKKHHQLIGFRGWDFSFHLAIRPHGNSTVPVEDAMEISLIYTPDPDGEELRMQVEWSASIVQASGEVLATSVTSCVEFDTQEEELIQAENSEGGDYLEDDLVDATFTSHQRIREMNLLSGDDLHVVADIRFKILEGGYAKRRPAVDPLLEALRHQLDSPIFSDLTIVSADGTEIKTHKLILALSSPVFRAMLESDLEEARTGVVKIQDATTESIKAMLAFLVGVEPQEWTFGLTKSLLELAHKYDLKRLIESAWLELGKLITVDNLSDVLRFAYRYEFWTLLTEAFVFLEDNIGQATADGVLVRLLSGNDSESLFLRWQAHWSMRKNGGEVEGKESPDVAESSDQAQQEAN